MSEHDETTNLTEETQPTEKTTEKPRETAYTYRWTYDEQRAFDEQTQKKGNRRGAIVFACTMTTAFLLVLGLLIGVLAFRDRSVASKNLTTEKVADAVLPSTVLIYSASAMQYGYGTGFFVRQDGYIATNYHVVEGANSITVTFYPSGQSLPAEVVGYSAADDLAVIRVEGNGYPVAKIGDSDAIRVGDVAIAIGNPAGTSAPWTTTQGIISSTGRTVTVNGSSSIGEMNMIQTDAPVNPGNSGGPLCNGKAEVVGIVTQKLSDYESLGFAIPINGAMKIIHSIIQTGSAAGVQSEVSRVRPTIGIMGSSIKSGDEYTYLETVYHSPADGVLVASVNMGSGADGVLNPGDVIVAIDGKTVSSMDDLIELLYTYSGGDTVTLRIYPLGESTTKDVRLTLGIAR